jgi:protein-S-isoprenylcysteine O-methyltransferase Ste14
MQFPFRNKFRIERGPLRSWLVFLGLIFLDLHAARFVAGAALVIVGTAYHFVCKCYLRQNRELTVSGPYRFTRHPFYLANLVIESGLLVIVGNVWLAVAYLAAWFWIYGKTIAEEEATLDRLFGDAFARYRQAVPRLFPIPGRWMPRGHLSGPAFSLKNRNISQGAEIQRSLRILSYLPLFLAAGIVHDQGITGLTIQNPVVVTALGCFFGLNGLGHMITAHLKKKAKSRPTRTGARRQAA